MLFILICLPMRIKSARIFIHFQFHFKNSINSIFHGFSPLTNPLINYLLTAPPPSSASCWGLGRLESMLTSLEQLTWESCRWSAGTAQLCTWPVQAARPDIHNSCSTAAWQTSYNYEIKGIEFAITLSPLFMHHLQKSIHSNFKNDTVTILLLSHTFWSTPCSHTACAGLQGNRLTS